ncbi:SURF1 family protein [Aromatoleum aromaticum EbN1]|uniref:SURF1-like protein n=2 Tax=Aromatoleum aromaticum TaxID=551760 RepID=Q5P2E6_AROAE|nr:SURF1 family protein [Aromatoleum aromaticum]NMG54689.1 SURF1 family protein [Aromatoleum aromaticum]CAI08518.1 SURF1 family protein [Aromatoleum aromaticum EbN1]
MIFRRFHPLPLIAGFALALLTAQLGSWQLDRAAEKTALQARIESAAAAAPVSPSAAMEVVEWQPVRLDGEWVPAATIYLDNRVRRGRPGYEVLTPLRLAGDAGWVLVNRGWTAAGADRAVLPDATPAAGGVTLAGIVRVPQADPFTLAPEAAQGRVWQYLDMERYRALSGLAVRDWIVYQTSAAADGLQRDWPRPDAGIDRHRGYALQWYSLAGLSLVMTGVYVFRRFRS